MLNSKTWHPYSCFPTQYLSPRTQAVAQQHGARTDQYTATRSPSLYYYLLMERLTERASEYFACAKKPAESRHTYTITNTTKLPYVVLQLFHLLLSTQTFPLYATIYNMILQVTSYDTSFLLSYATIIATEEQNFYTCTPTSLMHALKDRHIATSVL